MPTIPTVTSIKRVIPTGQRPVAVVRNAGAIGEAMADVGDAAVDLGESINRRARYDAAMAEEEFLSRKYELDNEIENDPDYATLPQRYDERLSKVREEISGKLKTPGASNMFTSRAKMHADRGVSRAKGVSFNKERETETQRIDLGLNRLADSTAPDEDPMVGADLAEAMIRGGVERGYFTEPKGQELLKGWKDGKVKRKLEMMSPEQRIEAAKQDWFKNNIPVDMQADILVRAREQNRQSTAMVAIEGLRSKGLTGGALEAAINKETDPKMRDAMRTEADQADARARRDRVQGQSDLVDRYYPDILSGRMRVSDIPAADQRALGSNLGTLAAAESNAANGIGRGSPYPKYSDPVAIDEFNAKIAVGDYVGARESFNRNRAKFAETDFQTFSKVSLDGSVPQDIKPMMNIQQTVANRTKDKNRRVTVTAKMNQWYQDFQVNNPGKVPDAVAIDKALDAAFLDRTEVDGGMLWFDKTAPAADFDDFEIPVPNRRWQQLEMADPEIAAAFRAKYPTYSESELMAEYQRRTGAAR